MASRAPQRAGRAGTSTRVPPNRPPDVSPAAGLAATFTLLAVTFGLPGALFVFGRRLLPTTVVAPKVMWEALKRPDDGHIFLQGLYLAAWVGWFLFFLSVFLEIVAVVQHKAALRLPGLGWLQRGVGTLVTAAVVIVASPVAAMAAPTSSAHTGSGPVATAQAFAHGSVGAQAQQQRSGFSRAATAGATYTVRSGDSLWKIAQEQLGDPNRFADIAKLNDGRQMPDGSVFHYTEFLRSGWVLLLPPDAGAPAAAASAPAGGSQQAVAPLTVAPKTYTVRHGDSLTSIAQALLGDGNRWNEIFELNQGKPQPGGPPIWRPDLIWPGDILILPATAADAAPSPVSTPAPPQVASPAPTVPVQRSHMPDPAWLDAPGPAVQTPPVQVAPPTTQPARDQTQSPVTSAPVTSAAAPVSEVQQPADGVVTFTSGGHNESGKTIGTIGGLLAAGLLTTLGTRRLARLRQRRPGDPIHLPPPDEWETEMRSVENPTGRVFIDAALRTLSARLAEVDRIVPDLTATVLKPHGLEIHLSRMEPPVSPFYADAARPGVWVCPLGAPLATVEDEQASQAPYPALVSLGFDEGDDAVLVDLESTRGLSLMAPTRESVDMLRAMAVELGTGTWADQIAVTMVGFGAELPSLFPAGVLNHVPDLAPAVEDLARWSATVEAILDKRDVSLREARTYPDQELVGYTKTHILMSAIPLDPQAAYLLRQILSGRQRTSVAVVALVQNPEFLLSPWAVTGPSFRTPPSQPGGPGLHIRMQALREEQYAAIIRDLSGDGLDDEWASAQRSPGFGSAASTPHLGETPRQFPATPPPSQLPQRAPQTPPDRAPRPAPVEGRIPATLPPRPPRVGHARRAALPPGSVPILPVPEPPPNRYRIPVDDLFRIDALPPADPATININIVPTPGAAEQARHALIPANLPQFDVVVTPWHGDADTEQILAVPNAAPVPTTPKPMANHLGLTTFAPAGSIQGSGPTGPAGPAGPGPARASRPEPDAAPARDADGEARRPGQWQSAYWEQRKAAGSAQQNVDVDPSAMSRSIDFLGPIELSGTPGSAGTRAADLAEVAAFIVLHPDCSANQIAAELWPGRSGAVAIRDAQVARLREWLGTDVNGDEHLRITPDGYRMGMSVSCDWLEFAARVQAGELVSAISLIRGRPFQDAPLRRYGWAETLRHEMTALVIDTAHYVAEACLRERNPRGAQNAAYRGLQAAPESELLYRDLLTALSNLGDMAAARQHADTLIAYADREGIDLQPETTALIRDVLQAVGDA